ncbi:MAG: hypothetical protein FWC40_00645 [Proteobacteria bacterium]|nr:hypothetical protein [Pseudomonadota bacterium]
MKTRSIRQVAGLVGTLIFTFVCTFGAVNAHAEGAPAAGETIAMADSEPINDALKIAGWTTLGVGVATLITAGVITGLQVDLQKSMEDSVNQYEAAFGGLDPQMSSWELVSGIFKGKTIDDGEALGRRFETTNIVLWSVGGVLTAAGVVMTCLGYLYDFGSDDALSGMPAVNFAVTPEYQGVSLGWRF